MSNTDKNEERKKRKDTEADRAKWFFILFCLTMVNDAIFQQGLSQVDSFVRLTDLSTLYQPWHKLTGNTRERRIWWSKGINLLTARFWNCHHLWHGVPCCIAFCMEILRNHLADTKQGRLPNTVVFREFLLIKLCFLSCSFTKALMLDSNHHTTLMKHATLDLKDEYDSYDQSLN